MFRILRGTMFVVLSGAAALLTSRVYGAADSKCTIATKGDSPTAKACAEGGIKQAKTVMKQMVKAAKAGGVKFDCDDCHKDTESKYELTSDAREKFKKMLAAIK